MEICWLGHAAFSITSDKGVKIITDPYARVGEINYGEIRETADVVTVSHDHPDHDNVAAVRGNPEVVRGTAEIKGIKFWGISTYHDMKKGQERGGNTVICFEVDGMKVCHLGDLGHLLSDKQVAEVGKVDILLLPVGGGLIIDAKTASQVCDQLKPKVVIPMHFTNEKFVVSFMSGVDEFLEGKENVTRLDTSKVQFKLAELPGSRTILVLQPAL